MPSHCKRARIICNPGSRRLIGPAPLIFFVIGVAPSFNSLEVVGQALFFPRRPSLACAVLIYFSSGYKPLPVWNGFIRSCPGSSVPPSPPIATKYGSFFPCCIPRIWVICSSLRSLSCVLAVALVRKENYCLTDFISFFSSPPPVCCFSIFSSPLSVKLRLLLSRL